MRRDDVVLLEELNFNAWPALRTVHYDGWLLRSAGGITRRPNSVNPMAPGTIPLEQKVETAERIYERWGKPAIFRFTPLADAGLDDLLAARGYLSDGATFVQTADVAAQSSSDKVRVVTRADGHWLAVARRLRGLSGEEADIFAAQHRAIGIETGWANLSDGDEALAVGVVGIERGWAGLHGIYVAAHARRQGLGTLISQALLSYAHAKGARRAWLQVEQNNAPALAVYRQAGFTTAYAYHYRIKPEQRR